MTTQDIPVTVDVRKYIETRLFGERPHIRGRRIPVGLLVRQIKANHLTVEQAAYNWTISEAEVSAALLYYEEYKDIIDKQEAEEDRLFDEMKRQHGNED